MEKKDLEVYEKQNELEEKIKKANEKYNELNGTDSKEIEKKGLFNPLKGQYEEISSDYFTLPDGLLLDGNLHKSIRLRPLSTLTRKKISKNNIIKNPSKIVDMELMDCIIEIDNITNINEKIVQEMTDTDRNFCQFVIQDITYGGISTDVDCENCGAELTIKVPFDSLEIKELPTAIQNNIIGSDRVWPFYKEGIGTLRLKLLKGKDIHCLSTIIKSKNVNREHFLKMIGLMVYDFNGIPVTTDNIQTWPIHVMDWIEECIDETERGISPIVTENCPECDEKLSFMMDIQSFLFLNPQRNTKRKLTHLTK